MWELLFLLKIKWLSFPNKEGQKGTCLLHAFCNSGEIHEIPNQLHPYQGPLL